MKLKDQSTGLKWLILIGIIMLVDGSNQFIHVWMASNVKFSLCTIIRNVPMTEKDVSIFMPDNTKKYCPKVLVRFDDPNSPIETYVHLPCVKKIEEQQDRLQWYDIGANRGCWYYVIRQGDKLIRSDPTFERPPNNYNRASIEILIAILIMLLLLYRKV